MSSGSRQLCAEHTFRNLDGKAETPPGVYQNRPTGTDDGRAERSDNLSEEKKKELKEVVDILKKMNEKELAATKFFGLGVVASAEGRTEPTAHK